MGLAIAALVALLFDMFTLFIGVAIGGTGLILAESLHITFSAERTVLFLAILFAFPAAAYIAGALIDKFCGHGLKTAPLARLGGLIAAACLLGVGNADDYLAALSFSNGDIPIYSLLVKIISNIFFCGCLTAFVIVTAVIFFEFTANWLLSAFGVKKELQIQFAGIRTLISITLLTWSLDLISDFYWHELSPSFLLG